MDSGCQTRRRRSIILIGMSLHLIKRFYNTGSYMYNLTLFVSNVHYRTTLVPQWWRRMSSLASVSRILHGPISTDNNLSIWLEHGILTFAVSLLHLAKRKFIRFRIHCTVDHLVESRSQFVTMRLDCKSHVDPCPSFEVHFIELDTNILRSAGTNSGM